MIESKKINDFLNSWIDGIIRIGKVYLENGDYKESAEKFVETHYAFDSDCPTYRAEARKKEARNDLNQESVATHPT